MQDGGHTFLELGRGLRGRIIVLGIGDQRVQRRMLRAIKVNPHAREVEFIPRARRFQIQCLAEPSHSPSRGRQIFVSVGVNKGCTVSQFSQPHPRLGAPGREAGDREVVPSVAKVTCRLVNGRA